MENIDEGIKPQVIWVKQVDKDKHRIMTHKEKMEYIINGSLEYLGLSKDYITVSRRISKRYSMNKRYIVPILYDYTRASMYEVAEALGYQRHSNALYHYSVLKNELSDDVYGYNKTKMIYRELLEYLGIDSNGHITKPINHEETKEGKE